jgi:hypothetical protein
MQTCIVKVRKDGLLAPTDKVRKQMRRWAGDELEIVMRRPRGKEPLQQVREMLNGLVTREEGERWLRAPVTIFEGRRPIDLIDEGEADRVIQILECLEEGSHV